MAQNVPFNIRKVNGQWLFTDSVFGSDVGKLPSELKIVPANLVPETVFAGGKKGYIPESQIISYLQGGSFTAAAQKVYSAGVGVRGGNVAGVTQAIAAEAVNNLRGMDERRNAALAKAAPGKEAPKGEGPPTISNVYDYSQNVSPEWSKGALAIGTNKYAASDGKILAAGIDGEDFLLLPRIGTAEGPGIQRGATGGLTNILGAENGRVMQSATQYESQLAALPMRSIKLWQKALGMPVDGIFTGDLQQKIMEKARAASFYNWNRLAAGETKGFTPMDPLQFAKSAAGGGSGAGGTKTYSESKITQFSIESAGALVTDIFQSLVGRDPSQQETKQWMQKLNAAAKAKPTTGTSTVTQTGSGSRTSTVNKTGFGEAEAGMMVRNQLAMSPESQSLMASTNLYDAFLQAIQNPIG